MDETGQYKSEEERQAAEEFEAEDDFDNITILSEDQAEELRREDYMQTMDYYNPDNMPTDPSEYFKWLTNYHDPNRIVNLPSDVPKPSEYDYSGITVQKVEKALNIIREQRANDPEKLKEVMAGLSPIVIDLLNYDPTFKPLTEEEVETAGREKLGSELERLQESPLVQELVKEEQGYSKYVHSTASKETAEKIISTGLNINENSLGGSAVSISGEEGDRWRVFAERHRDHPIVVVLQLPIPSDEILEKMRKVKANGQRMELSVLYSEELPEKIEMHGAGLNYDSYIPPRYIRGYLDTITLGFHDNPKYNPNITKENEETLEKKIKEYTQSLSDEPFHPIQRRSETNLEIPKVSIGSNVDVF